MNRLLAKLPRSSKGSRELSASSSAAALPADIFEVSISGADLDLAEDSFAPVSALTCSGGASSGDFMNRKTSFPLERASSKFPPRQISRRALPTVRVLQRFS